MKFFTACAAFLMLAFAAQTGFAQKPPPAAPDYLPGNWKEYQYPEDNVKFRFPADPSVSTSDEITSGINVRTRKYVRSQPFLAMELWVVNYPSEFNLETFKPASETIRELRNAALQSVDGLTPKIIKETDITVDGHPGKFMHLEGNNDEVLRFKFFLVKNRMYYAFASVKKNQKSGVNYENDFEKVAMGFLDSIKIIPLK